MFESCGQAFLGFIFIPIVYCKPSWQVILLPNLVSDILYTFELFIINTWLIDLRQQARGPKRKFILRYYHINEFFERR